MADRPTLPHAGCPDDYVCSISLDIMVNPVKLKQTGQIYDHASFHEWLTQGGSICPMTARKLKNPIVLQPQTQLRNEIWQYKCQQQQQRERSSQEICRTESEDSSNSWDSDFLADSESLKDRREQIIQHKLAAAQIPDIPADPGDSLYKAFISWFYKRGQAATVRKPRPSTYFVSAGNHVYSRGDLD